LSEWRNFTEVILNLGAGQAYLEYYKDVKLLHKSEPSEEDFRKKVIFYTSKVASYEEQYLTEHKKKFHEYFKLVKGHLERKEDEEDLEKIIQEWYEKLIKETA
jgi:tRNA(Ser,Leu) C12 N-acetylase TAN1